ncbi:MAG: hypothetical protein V4537_14415 [Pseudomonadota bacterium]
MSDEKDPGLAKSAPPRSPLTDFEIAILLDRIQRDQRANREEQRREFELIRAELVVAKANDERFKGMEHDFRVAKWFTGIAGGAAIIALVTAFMGKITFRSDPPPPPYPAERMGPDRVPAPTPPPLQGR